MKFITIFILISAFLGVVLYTSLSEHYVKIAHKITAQTAKKLEQEKGLILAGTGGGMMDDIKMMMMSFEYRKVVNLETARKLLVECVEEYASAINASEKVRPYLHNYPFTFENIEIEIIFRNSDGSKVSLDEINVASANEGRMSYYMDDPEQYSLKLLHEETYEEALEAIDPNKNYMNRYKDQQ